MTFLKRVLIVLVWLLIAATGAGILAAFVRPAWAWPLALVAILVPGLGILLLTSLLVTVPARRWVPASIALGMVLFIIGRHISPGRWSTPPPGRGDLTVMSYNAPKDPDDDKARAEVTALISRINPDVVALQESVVWSTKDSPLVLHGHYKLRDVIDSLGYVAAMPPLGGPAGVRWTHWRPPVLTRFPPDRQEQIEIESKEGKWPPFHVLRTEITWEKRKMALYNIHLTSHGIKKPWLRSEDLFSRDAWVYYLTEVRNGFKVREWQVDRVVEVLEKETLPVVLTGDFNSTPDSWTYRLLQRGLQDAYRLSGSGWGATFHAAHPVVRIDFVLLGQEFEPVSAFVASPYPSSSDHRPLVARFRWKEETN